MKGFALAVVGVAFTGSAYAADLAVKAPPSPAYAPLPTWTGCYLGANIGGAFGQTDFTRVGQGNVTLNDNFGSQSPSSVVGGGQMGCDYQVSQWVFGVQGLIDATDLNGSNVIPVPFSETFTIDNKNEWYATVTGRIGYTVTPWVLLYGKGGVAFAENKMAVFGPTFLSETANADRTGWTAGAGVEWMFRPNFSVFAEYQHLDFGSKDVVFTPAPGTVGGGGDIISTKQQIDTVMAGVNYHFRP
jgi:outer membrane immunogenic protein